jgi:hypothetical protein
LSSYLLCLALIVGSSLLLRGADRLRAIFSVLAVSVPLGLFLYASTNPSGVAIAAIAGTSISSYASLSRPVGRGTLRAASVACGSIAVACLTRPDSVYFAVITVCAAALAAEAWRHASWALAVRTAVPLASVLALFLLTRNRFVAGTIAADSAEGPSSALGHLTGIPSYYVGDFATTLGWLDTHMPSMVWGLMALVLGGLLILGIAGIRRGRALAVGLLSAALVLVPLFLLRQTGASVGQSVQPRYLLPLVVTLAVTLAVGGRGSTRLQWMVLAVFAAAANSVALHTTLRRYLTGSDVASWNLNRGAEWWWDMSLNPMTVWLLGSAGFALLVLWLAPQPPVPVAGEWSVDEAGSDQEVDNRHARVE